MGRGGVSGPADGADRSDGAPLRRKHPGCPGLHGDVHPRVGDARLGPHPTHRALVPSIVRHSPRPRRKGLLRVDGHFINDHLGMLLGGSLGRGPLAIVVVGSLPLLSSLSPAYRIDAVHFFATLEQYNNYV